MASKDNLTNKQRAFVAEYLVDLNATQAAIRAGYSPRTAGQQGPRLLRDATIQVAISKAMEERSRRTGITDLARAETVKLKASWQIADKFSASCANIRRLERLARYGERRIRRIIEGNRKARADLHRTSGYDALSEQRDAAQNRIWEMEDRITDMPVTTRAGAAAKMDVLIS